MRRSAIACAYKNGLRVEPGWRSAVTPSTSAAALNSPEEPTQASTSPLALSSTTIAPSSTWRPRSSRKCCCRVCTAKRCSGARRLVVIAVGTVCDAAAKERVDAVRAVDEDAASDTGVADAAARRAKTRRARCGAMPVLASNALRCSAAVVIRSSASQSGLEASVGFPFAALFAAGGSAAPCCICPSTSQARRATTPARALGARTSAAVMAASRSSRPCAALPNSVRLIASMPTSSPRSGTRFR